jgi:hypothetical protein
MIADINDYQVCLNAPVSIIDPIGLFPTLSDVVDRFEAGLAILAKVFLGKQPTSGPGLGEAFTIGKGAAAGAGLYTGVDLRKKCIECLNKSNPELTGLGAIDAKIWKKDPCAKKNCGDICDAAQRALDLNAAIGEKM